MQVVVGRIGRAHGLSGDVAVEVRTDEPETVFAPGRSLLVEEMPGVVMRVAGVKAHGRRLLVRFAGIDDRAAAEGLSGRLLAVDRPAGVRPEDPEEFYDHQLVGLAAVDLAGSALGVVRSVVHLPGQDLLGVQRPDGREFLVPFVQAIVPRVDLAGRRVVLSPPGGLVDLGADGAGPSPTDPSPAAPADPPVPQG